MLFSATQTRKVEDLARISLKKEPLYVGVDDNKDKATVDGLEQVLSHKLLYTGQIQRKPSSLLSVFHKITSVLLDGHK